MVPKALSISGRHSTLAPQSSSRKCCFAPGMGVASAGRLTPLTVRTRRLVPTCSAPVEPAETKASPSPFFSMVRPLTMLESVLWRTALTGSSCMVISSLQSTMAKGERSMLCCFAQASSLSLSPSSVRVIPSPNSFTASAAPCNTHSGALSPPMASTKMFIVCRPFYRCAHSRMASCARALSAAYRSRLSRMALISSSRGRMPMLAPMGWKSLLGVVM